MSIPLIVLSLGAFGIATLWLFSSALGLIGETSTRYQEESRMYPHDW